MNQLKFETLRLANIARLPLFKDKHGRIAHTKPDGSDWSFSDWLEALVGELGEYANVMKKVRRGDLTYEEAKLLITEELADVMCYLDILAYQHRIDLGQATQDKFNKVSIRVGVPNRIENDVAHSISDYLGPVHVTPKKVSSEEVCVAVEELESGKLLATSTGHKKTLHAYAQLLGGLLFERRRAEVAERALAELKAFG